MKKKLSGEKIALIVLVCVFAPLVVADVIVGFALGWGYAKAPWDFVADQVLGMKWLNDLVGLAISSMTGPLQEGSWQATLAGARDGWPGRVIWPRRRLPRRRNCSPRRWAAGAKPCFEAARRSSTSRL